MPATDRTTSLTCASTRLLVAGATGKYTSALVDALSAHQQHDHGPNSIRTRVQAVLDYGDPTTVDRILSTTDETFDTVYLVPAAHTPDATNDVRRLLDGIHRHQDQAPYVVVESLMGAECLNSGILSRRFADVEALLKNSGIPHTILRCAPFQQAFLHLASDFHQSIPTLSLPLGARAFAPVDATDVARVAAECLAHPDMHADKTYTLTGPDLLTGVELAGRAATSLNRPVRFRNGLPHFSYPPNPLSHSHPPPPVQPSSHSCCLDDDDAQGEPVCSPRALSQLSNAVASGALDCISTDVSRITGHPALPIQHFFETHKGAFNAPLDDHLTKDGDAHSDHVAGPCCGVAFVSVAFKGAYGGGLARYSLVPSKL